jgi:hypothetical protein
MAAEPVFPRRYRLPLSTMENEVCEAGGANIHIDKILPATRRDMMADWEPGARVLPGERVLA